ncbi:glycosyltransferase family 4 protein [Methylocaldum sp. MU1018]
MEKLRLVIVEPVIPKYRAPLFERLAAVPEFDLTVLADLETKDQLNQYDARVQRFRAAHLAEKKIGAFRFRPGLFGFLRRLQPDVVVLKGNPRDLSQLSAMSYCRKAGIPFAVWSMFYRIGRRRRITTLLTRYMGRSADLLLSYGERGFRELRELGVAAEKITVLHNCIDEGPIKAGRDRIRDADLAAFKSAENLDGKRLLLQVVRMTAIKRTDFLLRAYAVLAARRPDTLLVLIGGGPLEGEMRRLAEDLGIRDRVRFVGPLYDEAALSLWYKSADVFAMATCVGLSIHHAMAYGVPVVTDDDPLTQTAEFEILQNGVNGLTYRAGDIDDFVAKVSRILDDPALRRELSRAAVRRVEDDYAIDRMAERFAAAVKRLHAGRGRDSAARQAAIGKANHEDRISGPIDVRGRQPGERRGGPGEISSRGAGGSRP